MTPRLRQLVVATLCLGRLALATPAHGAPKTHIVVMANGDRVTCEIKRLDRGLLEVSTDDMGTIKIEWIKVASVTAQGQFEVETWQGTRLFGALAAADGQVVVVGGGGRVSIAIASVVRIAPIETSFVGRLQGSIDLGGSYARSSGVAQLTSSVQVGARRPSSEWQAAFDSSTTLESSQPDTGRYAGHYTYTRLFPDRWLLPVFGRMERNPDLGYDIRGTGGAGFGRRLRHTNRTLVWLAGGLAVTREVPVEGSSSTDLDAVGSFAWSFVTYDFPKTQASLNLLVFPSLSDAGRVRINATSRFARAFFTNDLFLALTFYDEYDSRPPDDQALRNDVGLTLSLGWSF